MYTIILLGHTLVLTNLSHVPISSFASCVSGGSCGVGSAAFGGSCGVGSAAVLLQQSQKNTEAHTIPTINNKPRVPPTIANVVITGSDGCGKDDFNIALTPNTPPTDIASSMIIFPRYKQNYEKSVKINVSHQ